MAPTSGGPKGRIFSFPNGLEELPRTLATALGVPGGWRYAGAVLLGEAAGDDPPSASAGRPWRATDTPVHRGGW